MGRLVPFAFSIVTVMQGEFTLPDHSNALTTTVVIFGLSVILRHRTMEKKLMKS